MGIPEKSWENHRLHDFEVIELSPQVSFILVLPAYEDVCIVPGQNKEMSDREDFILLPIQVFELINMCTYQPDFISRYSRLASILEMDLILAQQTQREAFSKEELSTAKDRVQQLGRLQQDLDKAWKEMRWVMDIITYARDRSMRGGISLSAFLSSSDGKISPEIEPTGKLFENNNSLPSCSSTSCSSNEISVGKDNRKFAKFYDPTDEVSQTNGHIDTTDAPNNPSQPDNTGILRVFAAYECGLAKGTSVKLHVTMKTTAREVINLVVRNLNQAVINKGKTGPVYMEDRFTDFVLVAVIGARERILRDDYQPLQLQNPWTKGRLYVRLRNNLLAAIQQGHATTV